MILYGYYRSTCTWRVRIGLHHKELPFEYRPVHLLHGEQHADAHREHNPLSQVPVLEIDGRQFTQSLAILELLEQLHPERPLLPADPFLRARARQLAEIVNAGIQPLQNLFVTQKLKAAGLDDRAWGAEFIARGLGALESIARHSAGRYAVGDAVTLADACIVPQLANARRFHADLSPYPTLLRIEKACAELPAFQKAHPDRQPDAPAENS